MEYWNWSGAAVTSFGIVWVVGEERVDPIAIVSLLFELLNQPNQSVFEPIREAVKFFELLLGELSGTMISDIARHRFTERRQCDVQEIQVFAD